MINFLFCQFICICFIQQYYGQYYCLPIGLLSDRRLPRHNISLLYWQQTWYTNGIDVLLRGKILIDFIGYTYLSSEPHDEDQEDVPSHSNVLYAMCCDYVSLRSLFCVINERKKPTNRDLWPICYKVFDVR